ncbi:MAG: aminotransferase class I/II-fold pyridoxal phosphate-dependent enzyme [Thermomicrobiales bacterium]
MSAFADRDPWQRLVMPEPQRFRLDLVANPFGPSDAVIDAIASVEPGSWLLPAEEQEAALRVRLGALAGVPASWVTLANGIDELHAMIAAWRGSEGPLLLFTPTDPGFMRWLQSHADQIELIRRTPRFGIPVEANGKTLPRGATAIVMSPNDPTGTILAGHEAVRLSRQCAFLVVDERHGGYSPRSAIPLAREFENVIVLQTFETWASLPALPLAWAISPPSIAKQLAAFTRPSGIARLPVIAALATLDDHDAIRASVRRVMSEKGRLFRQMRKLSMVSPPHPSWANFLLLRVERGTSDFFVPRLLQRGVEVFPVTNPELPNHFRASAVSADATNALKQALIDIALEL